MASGSYFIEGTELYCSSSYIEDVVSNSSIPTIYVNSSGEYSLSWSITKGDYSYNIYSWLEATSSSGSSISGTIGSGSAYGICHYGMEYHDESDYYNGGLSGNAVLKLAAGNNTKLYFRFVDASNNTLYYYAKFKVRPSIAWSDKTVSVSQSGYQAKVSWKPASVSNGTGSEIIKYNLYCGSDSNGVRWSGTATEATIDPLSYNTQYGYYVYAYSDSVVGGQWSNTAYATIRKPEITKQPVIQSINPSSGKSTTLSWSAATTVGTNNSTTIYYQYFVGPNSTYSDSYHVGTTTGLSATISQEQIINKCGSSFTGTCYLFVRAYWQEGNETGGWIVPTGSSFTYDPVELSAPGTPTVDQFGQTFKVSWSAASASGGSGNVSYTVIYSSAGTTVNAGTATSVSIPVSSSLHGTSVSFKVRAFYSGKTADSGSKSITAQAPYINDFGSPTVTQTGYQAKVEWNAASISYGTGSETITYELYCGNEIDGAIWTGTATSVTVTPRSYNAQYGYYVLAYSSGVISKWSRTTYATIRYPIITKQPSITSVSPSSGKSVSIVWSKAETSYFGGETVYYQYFVGPNNTYSDGYCVGETTELGATITQEQILSKCGNSFTGTCYLFVRAYWKGNGTSGGWITPSYSGTFVYDPIELGAPSNLSVSQSGQNFVVSWTAASASGGSGSVSYRITYKNSDSISYYDTTSTSATIAIDVSILSTNVQFYVTASYSGKSTTSGSVYITPQWPSVTAPTNVSIVQSGSQYTISWSASTGSYGSGSVYYRVACYYSDAWHDITSDAITATQGTFNCPAYGIQMQFRVHATYNAAPVAQSYSELYTITFGDPVYLGTPNAPRVTQSGKNFVVSWDAVEAYGGSGDVTYIVVYGEGDIQYAQTATSITFAIHESFYGKSVNFQVQANYSGKSEQSGWSYFTPSSPYVTAPGKPVVSQSGTQ